MGCMESGGPLCVCDNIYQPESFDDDEDDDEQYCDER